MSEQKMSTEEKAEIWADMIGDDFLYMAKQFREILDEAPEAFAMVAKFTGVGLRKAYALAQIDRSFRVLNIERKRLYRIGWTKLQLVANHITEENCEELLALAETSTVRELTLLLRNEVPLAGTRCVVLYLTPDQYEVFEAAIVAHGGKKSGRGLIEKEEALTKALTSKMK